MPASLSSSPPTQLLFCWCVRCLHKKNVLMMLQSHLTRFIRGLQLIREKEERRDEVVSWAELPVEMWGEVGKHLVDERNVVLFRAVCKQWRMSVPSPNRFPLQVPLPPDHADMPVHNVPYFITQVDIYSVDVGTETKPQRVLMEFEEIYERSKFRITGLIPRGDPLANLDICRDLRSFFVAKAYRLRMAVPFFYPYWKRDGERVEGEWRFIHCWRVSKIVLISSSNADANIDYAPTSNLSVVGLLTSGKLALLRLGESRDPNTLFGRWDTGFCTHVFYDIAAYKGQLCTIDCTGRAFVMDSNSLHMTQVAEAPDPLGINNNNNQTEQLLSMRLFEAHRDLYLVIRLMSNADVKVYKLCMRHGKWLQVGNTGNQVLLRGAGYNVSIPRDVLSSNYGSWMMKYKELDDSELTPATLLLAQDHIDNDDKSNGRANRYCFIGFELEYFSWFTIKEASTASSRMTSILSQYENSIGSTNYVQLLMLADLLPSP